jgi:hypothetical protein
MDHENDELNRLLAARPLLTPGVSLNHAALLNGALDVFELPRGNGDEGKKVL